MKIPKNKILWTVVIIAILIVFVFIIIKLKNGDYNFVSPTLGDLTKSVQISGKVVAGEEVDLSFPVSGDVIAVYKNVGDRVSAGEILARLDSSEADHEVEEARFDLESAKSRLDEISGSDLSSEIALKKDGLIKILKKAYVNADGIIKNQVDLFFESPNSRFPDFSVVLGGYFVRQEINDSRYDLNKLFESWKDEIDNLDTNNVNYQSAYNTASNLEKVEEFLSKIASGAYNFEPAGDITQSQIDAYLANIATGRTTIASLIVEVNTALDNLRDVEAEIPVQNASISNLQATVSRLEAKKSKYILRAPFNGVITKRDVEIGKIADTNSTLFSMISNSPYEIEVYIPEINIVGVDINDKVKLKFDALGDDVVIDAIVSKIDPKATIKDGVVTYKTLIDLIEPNSNLRPGMSSDVEIIKDIILNQVILPSYVIQKDKEKNFVEVKRVEKIKRIEIQILDKDNRGNVSVSGDLMTEDKVVIPK